MQGIKRYLKLGETELQVKWLEINSEGRSTTHYQSVPVKIFVEMPHGYVGPAKGMTVNAQFDPLSLEVPSGQYLNILSANKKPADGLTITLP